MSLVANDTSPLTNLAAIGQFDLLQKLYGSLLIADAAWRVRDGFFGRRG